MAALIILSPPVKWFCLCDIFTVFSWLNKQTAETNEPFSLGGHVFARTCRLNEGSRLNELLRGKSQRPEKETPYRAGIVYLGS